MKTTQEKNQELVAAYKQSYSEKKESLKSFYTNLTDSFVASYFNNLQNIDQEILEKYKNFIVEENNDEQDMPADFMEALRETLRKTFSFLENPKNEENKNSFYFSAPLFLEYVAETFPEQDLGELLPSFSEITDKVKKLMRYFPSIFGSSYLQEKKFDLGICKMGVISLMIQDALENLKNDLRDTDKGSALEALMGLVN